jgi:hypothetical protein
MTTLVYLFLERNREDAIGMVQPPGIRFLFSHSQHLGVPQPSGWISRWQRWQRQQWLAIRGSDHNIRMLEFEAVTDGYTLSLSVP